MQTDWIWTDITDIYICFHISVHIQIQIMSTMSDRIQLDINSTNMRFEYSDMDISNVEYPDLDTTDLKS
jgi:hypothetical protein